MVFGQQSSRFLKQLSGPHFLFTRFLSDWLCNLYYNQSESESLMIKPALYTILFLIVVAFAIVFGYYVYNKWYASDQNPPETEEQPVPEAQGYAYPVENFEQNQTKKVFGQYITKENSPIQPERFHWLSYWR